MMKTKPKRKAGQIPINKEETYPRKAIPLYVRADDSEIEQYRNLAKVVTSLEVAAYRVINGAERKSGFGEQIDVPALLGQLREEAGAVTGGDLTRVEAMLMNQATALQTLFSRLGERGMGCDQAAPFEANMRMALRAQSQCRATLETLAALKNPPIIDARQANVTTGPQQINNGTPSQAREITSEQSKLSGGGNELRSDTGASALEGGINPQVEAVGKVDRAEINRG